MEGGSQFEKEKLRILRVLQCAADTTRPTQTHAGSTREQTFHFESELEAKEALPLVQRFCTDTGFVYSYVCCGGKGHVIEKRS